LAKKQELKELKEARLRAEADRERAIKQQQAMESLSQAVSLGTAIANILKTYAGIPGAGLVIAGGVIAGMMTLFSSMKSKSASLTKYGEGGEIKGRSHSMGGVPIEAEGGEFVVRKKQYTKYKELVNAINKNDLPQIRKEVFSTNLIDRSGSVVVNDEGWRKLYGLLDRRLADGHTEINNGKKIVIHGIRKRITDV